MLRIISSLLIFMCVVLLSCSSPDDTFWSINQGSIPNNDDQVIWQENNLEDYVLEQRVGFFGPIGFRGWVRLGIENNQIISARYIDNDQELDEYEIVWYRTIDELFELIEASSNADSVIIAYDSVYGYPEYIFIDRHLEMHDEEMSYRTRLIPAGN